MRDSWCLHGSLILRAPSGALSNTRRVRALRVALTLHFCCASSRIDQGVPPDFSVMSLGSLPTVPLELLGDFLPRTSYIALMNTNW